jgi:MFS family permease
MTPTTTSRPAASTTASRPARTPTALASSALGSLSHGIGFWAVAFAFLVVMGYSAVPTPLYGLYAARDGFGSLTITIVFASYGVGVIASLFAVGHLSDFHGRRRVLTLALLLSALSAVVFLLWRDLPGLLVGRFINGLGIGAATATATAWIGELHAADRPDASSRRAEVIGVMANIGGIGIGPLVAGALAQWVAGPLTVPYLVYGGLLVVAVIGLGLTPETRSVPAHERPTYRPQQMHVPEDVRGPFFGALGAAFIAFAAFGLFTSLAPTFLAGSLHHSSRALAGFATFIAFAAAAVAQILLARRDNRELVIAGSAGLVLGSSAVVLAVWLSSPSLALFLVGGAVLGAGAGGLFKGAIATIIRVAQPERRAETLVGLFLAGYLGIMVPVIGLGVLTQAVQPKVALLIFGGMLVAGVVVSLAPLLRAARR